MRITSASDPDPNLDPLWIRIQKEENQPQKIRKSKSEDHKKYENYYFVCSHILGKEFGLKMFNVRKIR
jgi:hypothetical protein